MKALLRQVFTSILSYIVMTLFFLSSCVKEGRLTYNLSGEDWSIVSADSGAGERNKYYSDNYPLSEAIPSKVPGDIHWDLERAGIIPDLFKSMNARDGRWVTGKEWWYRKEFIAGKNLEDKKVRLRFDAVDYLADVWLNGNYLGQHEGQFTPFEFDVTDKLRFGQENILTIKIHSVPDQVRKVISEDRGEWPVMAAMRAAYPYWKSMTSSGWDWGTYLISMGIWQDVNLIFTEDVYASNLTVLPELSPNYDKARLNIKFETQAYKDKHVRLAYEIKCLTADEKPVVARKKVTLLTGKNDVGNVLEIQDPQLWWPNGYGQQHLYEMLVTILDDENGNPLDQLTATFGIRDLKMLANPKSPDTRQYMDFNPDYEPYRVVEITDSAQFPKYLMQINGKRIMGMGANWLPCDLLFGRPGFQDYEHLIRQAAQANLNLFRIWGGGIIDKQIFFDLCDKYGIMLFAEFPNGGVRLPETDEALKITASETRQILPLLMNHPSIVRYGGGNEWYIHAGNSKQMSRMRQICNEVDPTRPFHDPDPETIGQRHGPHGYEYGTHYQLYNTGYPLTSGPDNPFEWTEYGSSGASSIETLRRILPEESLWPVNSSDPNWIWHNGFNAYGSDNWLASYQYIQLFGQLPDLETTIRCSQFVQAEGLRYANQSMRRNQWHRSAFASWTYNEPWPNAAHGCLVEYYGQPKMAYYYAKKSCSPIDISCVYSNLECSPENPLDVEVWISSNISNQLHDNILRWRIFNSSGQNYYEGEKSITVSPSQSQFVCDIQWQPAISLEGDVVLLYLELLDPNKKVITDNLYTFGIRNSNQEELEQIPLLKPLLNAQPTKLQIRAINLEDLGSGNIEGFIEIENDGNNAALFVELKTDVSGDVKTYFDDNYFFLPEDKTGIIKVNFVSADVNQTPGKIKFSAKAWNSSLQSIEVLVN